MTWSIGTPRSFAVCSGLLADVRVEALADVPPGRVLLVQLLEDGPTADVVGHVAAMRRILEAVLDASGMVTVKGLASRTRRALRRGTPDELADLLVRVRQGGPEHVTIVAVAEGGAAVAHAVRAQGGMDA